MEARAKAMEAQMTPEARMTALIVEDDPSIRVLLRTLLEDHFAVAEAPNGVVALVQAWDVRPDVIILDRDMPAMGGAEASPYLRILSPKSVIVAFSAGISEKPLWADAYVDKSDAIGLVDVVRELTRTERDDSIWLQLQALHQDVLKAG